jgi:hypothetical protein
MRASLLPPPETATSPHLALGTGEESPFTLRPMANVVFLWHMHQPYYVDPSTQTATMPWVRLHSVKEIGRAHV